MAAPGTEYEVYLWDSVNTTISWTDGDFMSSGVYSLCPISIKMCIHQCQLSNFVVSLLFSLALK